MDPPALNSETLIWILINLFKILIIQIELSLYSGLKCKIIQKSLVILDVWQGTL